MSDVFFCSEGGNWRPGLRLGWAWGQKPETQPAGKAAPGWVWAFQQAQRLPGLHVVGVDRQYALEAVFTLLLSEKQKPNPNQPCSELGSSFTSRREEHGCFFPDHLPLAAVKAAWSNASFAITMLLCFRPGCQSLLRSNASAAAGDFSCTPRTEKSGPMNYQGQREGIRWIVAGARTRRLLGIWNGEKCRERHWRFERTTRIGASGRMVASGEKKDRLIGRKLPAHFPQIFQAVLRVEDQPQGG